MKKQENKEGFIKVYYVYTIKIIFTLLIKIMVVHIKFFKI